MKKKQFHDEEEVREYVENKLGPMSDEVWELLIEDNYVSEILWEEPGALRRLLERASKYKRLGGRQRIISHPPAPPDYSYITRSRLFALEAGEDLLVKRFRAKYLPDGLLKWSEVTPWIEARAREDGEPALELHIFGTADMLEQGGTLAREIPAGTKVVEVSPLMLSWVDEQGETRRRHIAYGGVLHRLQYAAHWIANAYAWHEASATTFILTGLTPLASPLTTSVTWRSSGRVTVTIRADIEVSPAEVARAYSLERQSHITGYWRPPSQNTLEMVNFRLDRLDRTWRECWQEWNNTHPDRQYPCPERMKRDYHRAVKRLREGIKYRWPGE